MTRAVPKPLRGLERNVLPASAASPKWRRSFVRPIADVLQGGLWEILSFGEREALFLLNRRDLPSTVIQELASHANRRQ